MKKVYLILPAILLLVMTGIYFTTPASAIVWQDVAKNDDEAAFLGITMGNFDKDGNDLEGAYVFAVTSNSPADKAGIERGDVIIAVNGKKIVDHHALKNTIEDYKPGDEITLTVKRDGEEKELIVTLGKRDFAFWVHRKPDQKLLKERQFHILKNNAELKALKGFGMDRYYLGIDYRELNKDLAKYFKSNDAKGVVILEVEEGSPAYEAGMKAGDVILSINDRKVVDSSDLLNALRIRDEKAETLNVTVLRDGSRMDISVKAKARENMFHFRKSEFAFPDEAKMHTWYSQDGERSIIIESENDSTITVTEDDDGENAIVIKEFAEMDAEPNTTKSIVIAGDGEKTTLMIHEDGTVSLNDRKFKSMEEFKKFLNTEEGKAILNKNNGDSKNLVKIHIGKDIISI